jgi:hypothetical protein
MQRRRGHAMSESESEMSPGSLLSTGYIAGASIAGVVYAFIAPNPDLSDWLSKWQYRTTSITQAIPTEKAYDDAARRELGLPSGELEPGDEASVKDLTGQFAEINESELPKYIPLEADTKLKVTQGAKVFDAQGSHRLAADEDIPVPSGVTTLGDFAGKVLGNPDKAASVFENNKDKLKLPEKLPAGAVLNVPQRDQTALIVAGAMVLFLLLVGLGMFLKTPSSVAPASPSGSQST